MKAILFFAKDDVIRAYWVPLTIGSFGSMYVSGKLTTYPPLPTPPPT